MQLIQRNKDSAYLQYDKYVNYDNPIVAAKAKELAAIARAVMRSYRHVTILSGIGFLTHMTATFQ